MGYTYYITYLQSTVSSKKIKAVCFSPKRGNSGKKHKFAHPKEYLFIEFHKLVLRRCEERTTFLLPRNPNSPVNASSRIEEKKKKLNKKKTLKKKKKKQVRRGP